MWGRADGAQADECWLHKMGNCHKCNSTGFDFYTRKCATGSGQVWKRVVLDAAGNRPTCNAGGHFTERTYMGCGCPSDRPLWLMLSNKTGDGIAHRMCANQADCHDGKRLVECSHVHCRTQGPRPRQHTEQTLAK